MYAVLVALALLGQTEDQIVRKQILPTLFPNLEHSTGVEVRLADRTRVDILTEDYAIEVDFATKWAEAIGQALHYARMTGRKPGVIIIIRDAAKDIQHASRCAYLAGQHGMYFSLFFALPD